MTEPDISERLYQMGTRIEAITTATHSVLDMLDKYMNSSQASFEAIEDKIEKLNNRLNVLSARVSGIDAEGVLLESRRKRKGT